MRYNVLHLDLVYKYSMSKKKSATLNLHIDPELKTALREAALRDYRSVANMVEVLIIRYCEQEQSKLKDDTHS